MSEPGKCGSVTDALEDTVLMGIKLVGDVGKDLDTFLAQALTSEEVLKVVRETLYDIARTSVQQIPISYSSEEAKRLTTAFLTKGVTAAGQDIQSQVQRSPQYLRLRKSAENVVMALRCSKTGTWFDRNKKIIYILASGLIVAGAVGMYVSRSGDEITEPITALVRGKKITAKPIGSLEVSAGKFTFVPSKREFQVELGAAVDLRQIRVEVSVNAHAIDTSVAAGSASGKVIIPFGKVVTRVEGAYDPLNMKIAPVQLGLGVEFTASGVRFDLAGRMHFHNTRPTGGSIGMGIKGKLKGVPLNLDLGGKLDSQAVPMYFATLNGEW